MKSTGLISLVLAGCALAACQPTMTPVVPAGAAAYEVVATPAEMGPGSYSLNPGDVINVSVFEEPELSLKEVLIDQAGNLFVPLIGEVRAAGHSPAELSAMIEQAFGREYLRNPRVAVSVVSARSQAVSVEGEVNEPGVYPIQPGYTLLSAMALAHSPTKTAKLDEVLVFRTINGQRMGARFDLVAIRGGVAEDPVLLPGDVIVVGFSNVRGAYRDLLQAAPLLNVFTQF